MKKIILIGLLGSFVNIVNANPQESLQINQESFDLIKSALIRVLKENKELKERMEDLEDRTQKNADNLLLVVKNLAPKIEKIILAQNKTPEYIASVVNPQEKAKGSIEILKILDTKEIAKIAFIRESNVREKAGLDYPIIHRFNAGDTAKIVSYERIGNNIWYELEQGGFTHFHNIEFVEVVKKSKEQETQMTESPNTESKDSKESNFIKRESQTKEVIPKPNIIETKPLQNSQTQNQEIQEQNTANKGE